VYSSKEWLDIVRTNFPKELSNFADLHFSEVEEGTFLDRVCHYYTNLPNVVPDLIYLDGPDLSDVKAQGRIANW